MFVYFFSSLAEIEASDVDILTRPARSNPVNMPDTTEVPIQGLPVITGEGSASMFSSFPVIDSLLVDLTVYKFTGSYEQSPRLLAAYGRERYGTRRCDSESSITDMVPKVEVELQLKENLADAMIEMPPGTHLAGIYFINYCITCRYLFTDGIFFFFFLRKRKRRSSHYHIALFHGGHIA